jgi:hypothetical protein
MPTPAEALSRILEVFDRLGIRYAMGGSVASSVHGIPRMTMDMDLLVDLPASRITAFAEALKEDFYADPDLIRDAFAHGRAANLIHLGTGWKFDLFPVQDDEYSLVQLARRSKREIRPSAEDAVECAVSSAEDMILRKLEWYRLGGETSERQWADVRGICLATGSLLDTLHLRTWAPRLNVEHLLERLLSEVETK